MAARVAARQASMGAAPSREAMTERKAFTAGAASRGGSGRHRPMIWSRPGGFGHAERSSRASIRSGSGASRRAAKAARAWAFGESPRRKLALSARRRVKKAGFEFRVWGRDGRLAVRSNQRRQLGKRGFDRHVIDGAGGFEDKLRVGVGK